MSGADLLAALEESSEAFITLDLIHRLVPFAARLRRLDYGECPRAGLVAGVAVCAVDRPKGRAILAAAREAAVADGDTQGEGFGSFLEGLEDLGEGRLESATAWWDRSRALLGPDHPIEGFTMANSSLGAYQHGRLTEAIALAERALTSAELRRDDRQVGICGIYVAFFRIWAGDFARADLALAQSRRSLERLPPTDRYDLPLAWGQVGALAALRGQGDEAASAFETALELASSFHNEWHEAMLRSGRADFLEDADPLQALDDIGRALDYFDRVDERWWSNWARLALAVTHLRMNDLAAAEAVGAALMERELNDLERGRVLLVRGEVAARSQNVAVARHALEEAAQRLSSAGADFWAAKAEVLLAAVDRRRSTYHVREAARLAGGRSADAAWRRMLAGPGRLRIEVLGGIRVTVDGRPVTFVTHAEEETLAMLVAAWPRGVRAELIADRIWPSANAEQAVHRCDNLISSLRKALLPTTRIHRARGVVSIDLDENECDLLAARGRLSRGEPCPEADLLFLGDAAPDWAEQVQVELNALVRGRRPGSAPVL